MPMNMSGMSSAVRGLMPKSSGGRQLMMSSALAVAGYAGVNAYANDRDASQVNMLGATAIAGLGGTAAVMRNRQKQGHSMFSRPGNVNNKLFPGSGGRGTGLATGLR